MLQHPLVNETNGLINGLAYHASRADQAPKTVDWTAKGLTITRLRLLSDPGFPAWDVSYCHGEIDGHPVDVELPFDQLSKRRGPNGPSLAAQIVEFAKADRVNAKRLGILDAISTLC